MTKITKLKTGGKFEGIYSYSRIVKVDNWIFVANTAGRNPETKELSPDPLEQAEQVFRNIGSALLAVGSGLEDVVTTRVFIQDPKNTHAIMDVFGEKFRGIDPTVTVTNSPLASPDYALEIEVTAYLGTGKVDQERMTIKI
ncbi:Rid family hydrolase [Celeribacter halophilus]|uniref:Rid family hydrolase n=1 Tax=Celeribacter halophilus TaxID=576117 RepID=A0AAW7XX24_9RHOB|nr:Rid family hydrolase [Celeribacter halophilus]MDO6459028.1 Rid family hydrolase [Celeribacter halophilus]